LIVFVKPALNRIDQKTYALYLSMRFWCLLFILFFQSYLSIAQLQNLQTVKGLPTEEVYDLFADSKGYIWVGHALGISRYDGQKFTHFSSPDQTTTGISGICEDKQGKIWCYNFNGQLFYIEKEKMNLVEQYISTNETMYPSLLPLDSEIVVTTVKGLFVFNTTTMQGKYYTSNNGAKMGRSICIYRGHALLGVNTFYRYDKGKGFREIPFIFPKNMGKFKLDNFNFAPLITNDTIYASNGELKNLIYKLVEHNDTLVVVSAEKIPGTLKTIIKCDDSIWVNTQNISYKINTRDSIRSQYLSDIVTDKWNNKWYSSLQEGLRRAPEKYRGWQKLYHPFIEKGDFVTIILPFEGLMVYGTQGGKVYFTKDNKVLYKYHVTKFAGSVEHLFALPNGNLLVAPSKGLYQINVRKNYIWEISTVNALKNIAFTDTTMLLAFSQMLNKIRLTPSLKKYLFDKNSIDNKTLQLELKDAIENLRLPLQNSRCNIVDYDPETKKIYANFKSGLALIEADTARMLSYNGKQISAACLLQYNKEAYIGTFDIGLLILGDQRIQNISLNNGLVSNIILKIKKFHGHLYLIEPGVVQVFDLATQKFTNTITIPLDINGTVYDLYEENDNLILAMKNWEYSLSLTEIKADAPLCYLLSVSSNIDGKEISDNSELTSKTNALQFKLSSPFYINPEATHFMYQLTGTNDTSWKVLSGPDYKVSFASLKPGNYRFKAYAVNFQGDRSKNTLVFQFVINNPWWLQWWFIGSVILLVIAVSGFIIRLRYRNQKKRDHYVIEKLTLQNELRKSLLRTIVTQMNPHFIFNAMNTIQSFVYKNDKRSVSNYMGKFSELIRKILDTSNISSISLKEEIDILELYLDLEKARFESDFSVELIIEPELDLENIQIPPMFIQPCIENAIKHGLFHKQGLRHLKITITYDDVQKEYIRIEIDDDGIGRTRSREINKTLHANHKSFAGSALESRVDLINQTIDKKISLFVIDKVDQAGTTVIIRLPINSAQYD
jgi:ligand-binding sensor domain-containing protein/two-component sensor histidine kinase